MAARLIILNGTSSAGKATPAAAVRPSLPAGFCPYASGRLAYAGFRPAGAVAADVARAGHGRPMFPRDRRGP